MFCGKGCVICGIGELGVGVFFFINYKFSLSVNKIMIVSDNMVEMRIFFDFFE